jgi:hypothetical protein
MMQDQTETENGSDTKRRQNDILQDETRVIAVEGKVLLCRRCSEKNITLLVLIAEKKRCPSRDEEQE